MRTILAGAGSLALIMAGFMGAQSPERQPPTPPASDQPLLIKIPVDIVSVFFMAKDKRGALISDLSKENVIVEEDGRPQVISFFEKDTNVPLTIAMLIDTSGSIAAQNILPLEQEGAIEFLHAVMRKGDLSLVINFDLSVDLDQDFTDHFPALEKAIKETRVRGGGYQGPVQTNIGGTHLYDAIVLACDDRLRAEAGRKVMVLVTDGEDQGSKYKLNEALMASQKANTIIYPIYFQPRTGFRFSMGYSQPQFTGNTGVLEKLAAETGGKAFFPRSMEDLRKTFDQITTELHQQYRLGYVPANTARDGTFRKINLHTQRSDVKIVARKGYYAPREEAK